jgi:hypothetical protein
MPRAMVGLLAAVGAAMSALVGFTHGAFVWAAIADAAVAAGLVAFATAPAVSGHIKKISSRNKPSELAALFERFVARQSGRAFGLARANLNRSGFLRSGY